MTKRSLVFRQPTRRCICFSKQKQKKNEKKFSKTRPSGFFCVFCQHT